MVLKSETLERAIADGHLDIIEKLIKEGFDINTKNEGKMSSIHFAAESGHLNIIKYLIKNGASINDKDCNKVLLCTLLFSWSIYTWLNI
jgi:ankyrin repeat protein